MVDATETACSPVPSPLMTGGDGGPPEGAPEQSDAHLHRGVCQALRAESAGYRRPGPDEQLAGIRKAFSIPDGQDPDWTKVLSDHEATHKTALEAAEKNAKQALLRAEVRALGAELGVVDADVVWQLVDLSKAQIADDGKVTGVKEAISAPQGQAILKGRLEPRPESARLAATLARPGLRILSRRRRSSPRSGTRARLRPRAVMTRGRRNERCET